MLCSEDLTKTLATVEQNLVYLYKGSLRAFIKGLEKGKQAAFKKLIEMLKKGPIPLDMFEETLDMQATTFIELVGSLDPHPFFLNIRTRDVHLNADIEETIVL